MPAHLLTTGPNHDRTYYVVFNDFGSRIGIGETVISDRAELIDNIIRGELGYDNITYIHAYNPIEHTADVVSDEIFAAVAREQQRRRDAEDFPVTARAMEVV